MKKSVIYLIPIILSVFLTSGCKWFGTSSDSSENSKKASIMKEKWGMYDDKEVYLFTLKNKNGLTVKISNYGGIITSIMTPDKKGELGDIVLGYDSLSQYVKNNPYFGAIVGRYANRIAKGKFTLDGKEYQLAVNNGNNSLHGGIKGFDKVVWDVEEIKDSNQVGISLNYVSKDGEEGYPGNLRFIVKYILNDNNQLTTSIEAQCDKPTPVNLCNHTYFNLTGCVRDILGHELVLIADSYTEVNEELIPTGNLLPVLSTPMDFLHGNHTIGERINQVKGGYDHNYVLNSPPGEFALAAILTEPLTGRQVKIMTTQPGIQFYSGNFLDGTITGKGNMIYQKHFGLCLETQHFPDSPNQPAFPSTILRPGEKYNELTVYEFESLL
jgi:aldose 1-epimerase